MFWSFQSHASLYENICCNVWFLEKKHFRDKHLSQRSPFESGVDERNWNWLGSTAVLQSQHGISPGTKQRVTPSLYCVVE